MPTYILNYGVLPYENMFDLPMEQIPYSDLLYAGFAISNSKLRIRNSKDTHKCFFQYWIY